MFKTKKRGLSLISRMLVAVMIIQLFIAAPFAVQAKDISTQAELYVSPSGSDANDGLSAETAFATLAKARDAVRAINDDMTGDIYVYLMDGTWELDETLTFDERDSGTNGFTVHYQAAPGAKPIMSGGKQIDATWTVAEDVNWLSNGLKAYKTSFVRDDKIRSIYVNDQRASMTRKTTRPKRSVGSYRVNAGQADWAWVSGSKPSGNVFNSSFLPANTRNPQNIELESGSTWVKAVVCAASLEDIGNDETQVNFQMPYAAMAQTLNWNCAYNPTGNNDVTNVFEWLSKEGEFYFDQAGSTLYYIPRAGEDMSEAEVIVPELDQLINITGSQPLNTYVENIVFDGIKFAYADWNLYEVEGSHGNATVQAATVINKYADGNWHNDIYRSYDVPTAAIQVNTAKNVKFINGEISNTGYLGIHLENDVWNCDVTGNYIAQTGGAGVVIGHPQHVYENDTPAHRVGNGATYDKEKFPAGTESAPKHINITNNYLLENCYFFPGNAPITSFYTYDMKVMNNFIYKCSYSGMSIGWGWCEFDGTSSSKLPGKPTTTSRKNTISNNRIEEICSILQDAGGIYTLGQQGNEDWTEVTVMDNNFINAKRAPQQANGSRMVNGFHPDEGSAYITMDGNVVTNIIRNVYEMNNWQRKHDMKVTNSFSNTNRSETTAPNCTLELFVDTSYTWPIMGYNTVLNSGLENEYVHMVSKDVIGDTEYELASNVRMEAGMTLPRRGLLNADDTVWIAPQGTTVFAEGPTMTKAAGNVKSVILPETAGTYKLYIQYANGTVSAPSEKTIYLGEAKGIANVEDGMVYSISAKAPLVLELNTDTYSFKLNGTKVANGAKITMAGDYTLEVTTIGSNEAPQTIAFSTFISEANRLLPKNVSVAPGEIVELAENLNDPTLKIWLASQSASAFEESRTMTVASGDSAQIAAPKAEGVYDLSVVNANGDILCRSDAVVKVVGSVNYVQANTVEAGKQYVVVSNGYALTNTVAEVPTAYNKTSLGATAVTVENGMITSDVTEEMIWDFAEGANEFAGEFTTGYYLSNGESKLLSRNGPTNGNPAPLNTETYDSSNVATKPQWCYWVVKDLDEAGNKAMFLTATGEWSFALRGAAEGFDAPGSAAAGLDALLAANPVQLYEVVPVSGLKDIDFTDPESADRFEIVNQDVSAIREGEGLYMITTKDGFEPANGQLSGDAATTPKDLVLVPVAGDWSATLEFAFNQAGASNGYYQFFGFYAMEDYDNCAGIRAGDGAMQNFLRVDGDVTADSSELNSGPGVATNGTYWLRIEKVGTTYTCFRSADGEEFTPIFAYEDTGIEADKIAIDAYTGMTAGYVFMLKALRFEGGQAPVVVKCEHEYAAEVTAPTCLEGGFTTYTCAKCGESYVADETDALGHTYVDGECVRCGKKEPVVGDIPVAGYIMNFAADQGITTAAGEAVTAWANTVNNAQVLTQIDAGRMPVRNTNDNGMPYLTFDGAQVLAMNGVNFNDMSALTILLMSRNAKTYDRASYNVGNGDRNSPFYVNEASGWSGLYVNPYQDWIGVRFGSTVSNCFIKTTRAASTDQVTVAAAVKDGTVEKIYDEGAMLYSKAGQAEKTRGIGNTLSIGYSYSNGATYFSGDIYEIFVYDRALNDEEIAAMTEYLKAKYEGAAPECEHDYEAVVTAPTCTTAGFTTYTCAKCGESYVADEVAALGHDYEAVVTAPTCTTAGYTTYTCANCGDSYVADEVAALGHDYEAVVTAPTCTTAGYTTYTCANCGESYVADEVAALGHDFVDGKCTRCDAVNTTVFTDLPEQGNWARAGIDFCIENNLMNGYSETMFAPNDATTRAQLVTILYRMAGEPEVAFKSIFSDVKEGRYFAKAVIWAAENGIVNGVGVGKFDPNGTITREQIATIMYRYAGSPAVEGDLSAFGDAANVSGYAVDAMVWAVAQGIINGNSTEGVVALAPKGNATRAQIAAIIARFLAE